MRLTKTLTPAALLALVAVSATAPAASTAAAMPAAGCYTPFTDALGDHNAPGVVAAAPNPQEPDAGDVNLDIVEAWLDYDASKADKGLTANIRVADLSTRAAQPGTGVIWNFIFDVGGETRFVRAFTDLNGGPYFEWGVRQPAAQDYVLNEEVPENPMPLPRFVYQGATEGKLFEGTNGVVQIVVPKEAGGGAGAVLENPHATANASKQVVPASVNQAPTRGISTQVDIAPDDATPGAAGTEAFSAASCSPVAQLGGDKGGLVDKVDGGGTPAVDATPAAPAAEAPAAPAAAPQALTVSLGKATAKRLKKGKTLTLSLRGSEALTGVTVKLLKGRSVVAKGAAKQLGAVRLRVAKALKKGTYTVTITGTDASGAQRTATTSLKVR